MRRPNRLYGFYENLRQIHMTHFPDWRFGQLVENFRSWLKNYKNVDIFYSEENELIDYLKEFAGGVK